MAMIDLLISILSDYFEVGGNCYHYILDRVKWADLSPKDFYEYDDDDVAEIAEHLIDKGVTVQRWIPVTEQMPKRDVDVLVWNGSDIWVSNFFTWHIGSIGIDGWRKPQYSADPTHWMPLPEPPEEVCSDG